MTCPVDDFVDPDTNLFLSQLDVTIYRLRR